MSDFECRHQFPIDSIYVRGVRNYVRRGRLSLDGGYVCHEKIPITTKKGDIIDVSCVGPNNPNCPEPKSATIK